MSDPIVTNFHEFAEDQDMLKLLYEELPTLARSLNEAYQCLVRLDQKPSQIPDIALYYACHKAKPGNIDKMITDIEEVMGFLTIQAVLEDGAEITQETLQEYFEDTAPVFFMGLDAIKRMKGE